MDTSALFEITVMGESDYGVTEKCPPAPDWTAVFVNRQKLGVCCAASVGEGACFGGRL